MLAVPIMALYLLVLGVLSLNGVHRLWMVWAFHQRHRRAPRPSVERWPTVTVQLPMYNERYVAARLIEATSRLDYPRDRLFVQVLDDSTDDTTTIAADAIQQARSQGVQIELIHRDDRTGFKAGALDEGLATARGELVAVFDADFVPEPDFLKQTVPWFGDPGVGMVQARWGHLNADASWLTRVQATLLDGHFVIEHTARNATGRFFNFNGTAGVWRRQAITDGGGWQHDTLTEDLDLSYRSQLAGWRFVYLHDVVAPAELPPTMAAFKSQQHRWAKGSIQTAKKLLGRIWRSDQPLSVKLEGTAHLTANVSYPLVVLLSLLMPFAVYARINGGLETLLWIDAVLFTLALLPFLLFYGSAVWYSGAPGRGGRLVRLPLVLALGMGMAIAQTRAVFQGLFGEVGTFVRTPKHGSAAMVVYRAAERGLVGLELAMASWMGLGCGYVVSEGYLASLPFLGMLMVGYGSVGMGSLNR